MNNQEKLSKEWNEVKDKWNQVKDNWYKIPKSVRNFLKIYVTLSILFGISTAIINEVTNGIRNSSEELYPVETIEQPTVEEEAIEEVTEENIVIKNEETTSQTNTPSKEEIETVILTAGKIAFNESANFNIKDDVVEITPKDPNFTLEVIGLMNGDLNIRKNWEELTKTIVELSSNIYDYSSEYTIAIVNPVNENNYLLVVYNDTVIYDFSKEL